VTRASARQEYTVPTEAALAEAERNHAAH
jgi:hypothetical protein